MNSVTTPDEATAIISPAATTPAAIEKNARIGGILSSAAIAAPDQAPVPGSGMATKIKRPHLAYLVISPFLLLSLPRY